MKYTFLNAPRNVVLWACAYCTNNTEKSMALRKHPVQGMIKGSSRSREYYDDFYEIGRNGEPKKSGSVYAHSRVYADTKEECVEFFNEKVDDQINLLKGLIAECEKDKI